MLSITHVYIHSVQSIAEATEKFPRGGAHLITWNGPIMGHLNSFLALGGGDLNKNANAGGGGLPGGGCLSFDLTGTVVPTGQVLMKCFIVV